MPTLAQLQYQELHKRIVSMELLPGASISESDLAERAQISRTPVREAILRLAREKLVEVVPKSGTFVARIPVSALPQALIARRALEGTTASAAAQAASRSQVFGLHAVLEQQREHAGQGNMQRFHQADEMFHKSIADIGRLPRLWQMVQEVKLQVDRFRRLTLPEPGRMTMAIEEHASVVHAIEQNLPDQARAAMDQHLSGLQLHIENVVNAHPEYFIHDADLNDIVHV